MTTAYRVDEHAHLPVDLRRTLRSADTADYADAAPTWCLADSRLQHERVTDRSALPFTLNALTATV